MGQKCIADCSIAKTEQLKVLCRISRYGKIVQTVLFMFCVIDHTHEIINPRKLGVNLLGESGENIKTHAQFSACKHNIPLSGYL